MAMEQILVNGVTDQILEPLISLISLQIKSAWGVKDDLKKLMETLVSIKAVIADAEKKQVNDNAVTLWLRRLKDVIYDADDVMDEFSYEAMRPGKYKLRALVSSSNPLVFKFKMARKIRAINENLQKIYKDRKMYNLQDIGITQDNEISVLQRNRLTTSVGGESIGREGAKSEIINLLMSNSSPASSSSGISSQPENISTLSIVGMGGLGKTNMAKLVYNDDSIARNFKPRAWVCVSETFDIYKIVRDIIESITEKKCEDVSNVELLAKQVKEKLSGKKYLLVLDDLWNVDGENWQKLKCFLACGSFGSKILVTTRNQSDASAVGGTIHHLEKLSDDACWSIIEKKVSSQDGATLTPEMINIGKKIAGKCDGLPLAANSLGSLMCPSSRRNQSYWLSILNNNDLWSTPEHKKKVISILKLSYDNLSFPLKQCFSYCSIFPKDWIIHRETLIRLWIAEGFLLPSSGGDNKSLEDKGNEYFEYLLWSSFFQDVQKDWESGDIKTCKMHDMVHELATDVLDCNEFGIAKVGDEKAEVSEVRRLQLLFDKERSVPSPKVLPTKLRTIIALDPDNFLHVNCFFRYRRLRVLCPLGDWTCLLSSSISKLKHLRYLDLSGCDLSPEVSLNHSYNLQTLVLRGCKNVPSLLLSEIGTALKNLRHLDISYTFIKLIPENIGLLKHLSFLDVSYTCITKLPESITCISSLRTLKMDHCPDLDALPRELGALIQLRCLDLDGTKIQVLPESCISNLCNFEIVKLGWSCVLPRDIKNWPKLRILTHGRTGDVIMPRGIERLTCLEILKDYMVNNNGSSGIEDLAGLNSLEELGIRNLEKVRGGKEGAERAKLKDKQHLREFSLFWGSTGDDEEVRNSRSVMDSMVLDGLQPHSSLKELYIKGFSGLKLPKWMMGCSLSICLPNLVELIFRDLDSCEKLPALGMLPFLRVLEIEGMKSIKCLGEEFYFQDENEHESGNTRKRSSLFPSLVDLDIDLENLEEWVASPLSSSSCFPSLGTLSIRYHQRLRTIPITSFSSLKRLRLRGTNDVVVESLLNRGERGGRLTSLTSISIEYSPDLIYLPPLGLLLQHNLQILDILHCSKLQGFRDDDDLNNTGSLRELTIFNCPVLTSLPDLRLCTSLRKLIIFGCAKLNKESIPYDLKKSLTFVEDLRVDFIESDSD